MTPEAAIPRMTRVAAYGLVVDNGRIVLCRLSSQLPSHVGMWTLPGGGLDFGENPADAMVREVEEETGLRVRAAGVVGVDSYVTVRPDRSQHNIQIIYATERLGGALRDEPAGTTDTCAWFTPAQARTLPLVDLARVGVSLAFAG